jgi:hypothetical protein
MMGIPHSLNNNSQRRATKVTLFFSVEEIRALHQRFLQLVPPNHVVFLENFTAYCLWSTICKTAETATIFFRAFDAQRRGYFDFEDFCMTAGALTRGTSGQLAEVLFRMIAERSLSATEAEDVIAKEEAVYGGNQQQQTSKRAASPYRETPADRFVRYQDVVDCIQALDSTFVCLKCDGGVSAQSVAARLPFDEFGHLSFEEMKKIVAQKL